MATGKTSVIAGQTPRDRYRGNEILALYSNTRLTNSPVAVIQLPETLRHEKAYSCAYYNEYASLSAPKFYIHPLHWATRHPGILRRQPSAKAAQLTDEEWRHQNPRPTGRG